MLCVTFDLLGPQATQASATLHRMARICTIMGAQLAAENVSTLTRAPYAAQFTPWTTRNFSDLDKTHSKLYRRTSGKITTFPTSLLYLSTDYGWLGLPRHSLVGHVCKPRRSVRSIHFASYGAKATAPRAWVLTWPIAVGARGKAGPLRRQCWHVVPTTICGHPGEGTAICGRTPPTMPPRTPPRHTEEYNNSKESTNDNMADIYLQNNWR